MTNFIYQIILVLKLDPNIIHLFQIFYLEKINSQPKLSENFILQH
jgi:hypothetical protein